MLEIILSKMNDVPDPRPDLEQYPTPAGIASEVLFLANASGLIEKKKVLDLGCGTGIFMIGAGLLGASSITGVDVDPKAVEVAKENARMVDADLNTDISSISTFMTSDVSDLECLEGEYDTVVMNPPFGAQKKGADRPFLDRAMGCAGHIASLHNLAGSDFVRKRIADNGWRIELEERYRFPIRRRFEFHDRPITDIEVILLISSSPEHR